tara:strand:- start:254 stop:955 length:702 start_codon:yes stop_codon:yes gene_type:complete
MNKYTNLSQEEMLAVCCIINPEAEWYFNQLLDNDGKGTDDCYEFLSDQEDIIQFNIHQTADDEIRCYLSGNVDIDEVPDDKLILIDNFLSRKYFISNGDSQEGPYTYNILKRKKIKKTTNIWYDGLDEWTEANNIIELKSLFLKDIFKNNLQSSKSTSTVINNEKAEQSWISVLLICWFFGIFGGHRFYTGHTKTGLIQLFTLGGFYIWWLIDFFTIISGNFKNSEGQLIKNK